MNKNDTTYKSPISGEEYLALDRETRAKYRPVDSKRLRLPRFAIIFFIIGAVATALYVTMIFSPQFSDWFNSNVSVYVRFALGKLTSIFPFSVAELIVWLIPLGAFLLLRYAILKWCDTWRTVGIFLLCLLSVVALFLSLFVFTFAAGYRGRTMDEKMELDKENITADELYSVALELAEQANKLAPEILYGDNGFSIMPHTMDEMNTKLIDAFDTLCEEYSFIPNTYTRIKPVLLSEGMSYMHITGIYTFFTGESNLNVNFPDYTLPFTAAHELAHGRGVAREDEANFIAFLVCIASDDPYIRYSGYVNMYEYVSSSLSKADKVLYRDSQSRLNRGIIGEFSAYSDFYSKYRNSVASNVSGSVNDAFLQIQGTPGTVSYGMVTQLTVGYFRKISPKT